jgi:hypothetical protein
MNKLYLVLACLFMSIAKAQNPLDDEKSIDLETWKNSTWKTIGDFWVSPISKKTKVISGKSALMAEGLAELKSPSENHSFLLSFEVNLSEKANAELKLNSENSIFLGLNDLGKIQVGTNTIAAEVNAVKSLGLWQKVEISLEDAPNLVGFSLINYLKINDVLVQQHVMIPKSKEAHNYLKFVLKAGSMALRNLKIIEQADIKPIRLSNIKAEVWDKFNWEKISTEGEKSALKVPLVGLNHDIGQDMVKKNHILKYDIDLNVDNAGLYNFTIDFSGKYRLIIDDKLIANFTDEFFNRKRFNHKITLSKGIHKIHLEYLKVWYPAALGVFVSGSGAKTYALHEITSLPESTIGGRIVHNPTLKTEIIRGFTFHYGIKNTTAMAVGFTSKYNYAIDLEKGSLLTIWKGGFADLTEMWFERGEPQTFSAEGMKYDLASKNILASASNEPLSIEYKGYTVDASNTPSFEYKTNEGLVFQETIQESGGKLNISMVFPENNNQKVIVAQAKNIEKLEKNLYKAGQMYIFLNDNLKPELISINGESQLLFPAKSAVSYQLAW